MMPQVDLFSFFGRQKDISKLNELSPKEVCKIANREKCKRVRELCKIYVGYLGPKRLSVRPIKSDMAKKKTTVVRCLSIMLS